MAVADRGESRSWSIIPVAAEDYDEIVKVWREAGLSVRRSGRDARSAFVHSPSSEQRTEVSRWQRLFVSLIL